MPRRHRRPKNASYSWLTLLFGAGAAALGLIALLPNSQEDKEMAGTQPDDFATLPQHMFDEIQAILLQNSDAPPAEPFIYLDLNHWFTMPSREKIRSLIKYDGFLNDNYNMQNQVEVIIEAIEKLAQAHDYVRFALNSDGFRISVTESVFHGTRTNQYDCTRHALTIRPVNLHPNHLNHILREEFWHAYNALINTRGANPATISSPSAQPFFKKDEYSQMLEIIKLGHARVTQGLPLLLEKEANGQATQEELDELASWRESLKGITGRHENFGVEQDEVNEYFNRLSKGETVTTSLPPCRIQGEFDDLSVDILINIPARIVSSAYDPAFGPMLGVNVAPDSDSDPLENLINIITFDACNLESRLEAEGRQSEIPAALLSRVPTQALPIFYPEVCDYLEQRKLTVMATAIQPSYDDNASESDETSITASLGF